MGKVRVLPLKETASDSNDGFLTATTPEARENQLIALAMDRAEEQLRAGTASSQVITHYLRLGSSKDRLEREILELQKDLVKAKTEALQSAKRIEELYAEAMAAFKEYNGSMENDHG